MYAIARRWQRHCIDRPVTERQWLTLPGSLTQALRRCGAFSLEVTAEGWCRLRHDETQALRLPANTRGWAREIVMSIDGTPCVAARSVTTAAGLHGPWRALRHQGQRPLGDILYHNGAIRRTPFTFSTSQANHTGSARRSVFYHSGAPLLISERFLPAFIERHGKGSPRWLPPRWSSAG
ncbi:chorismate--pyruvate lyase family protein [Carnimonas nigrificans]|uniref:chorismate--pyruvate lyase family protein n=1 Tax=Carnimonas nigrificans TaxID=64323 RepID=UPI00046FEBAC|nr:chorismate lyase [Carnimonas nigrificans]